MKRLLRCVVVAAFASTACAHVPPHARGRLMRRTMQAKPGLDQDFDAHVEETRESAIGATSGESASCGCR